MCFGQHCNKICILSIKQESMFVPGTISMATRRIPPTPWGVLPTPQAWDRAPREGSHPGSWQGDRGRWASVTGGVLLCMLSLLPAGTRGAEDLGWRTPTSSSPANIKNGYVAFASRCAKDKNHMSGHKCRLSESLE